MFDKKLLLDLGRFTAKIKSESRKYIKPNVKIIEVIEFIEGEIFSNGFKPAFPCTISRNEEAAHFTIYDELDLEFKTGDVVKVDFGVEFKGHITDTAYTVIVGDSDNYVDLVYANRDALKKVIKSLSTIKKVSDVGKIVDNFAKEKGFNTIHNLSGHQIGLNNLHMGLQIPNYDNGSQQFFKPLSLYAIEPFFTDGDPLIVEGKKSNILHFKTDKPVRDRVAKRVLDFIKVNYPYLPFAKRWLLKAFDKCVLERALKYLMINGNIYEYKVLVSKSGDVITQFEETVFFDEDFKVYVITSEGI